MCERDPIVFLVLQDDEDDDYESPNSGGEDGSSDDYESPNDNVDGADDYEPPPSEPPEDLAHKLCPTLPIGDGEYIGNHVSKKFEGPILAKYIFWAFTIRNDLKGPVEGLKV